MTMLLTVLEWLAFGLGAVTVWAYGISTLRGAVFGVLCALTFVAWGAPSLDRPCRS